MSLSRHRYVADAAKLDPGVRIGVVLPSVVVMISAVSAAKAVAVQKRSGTFSHACNALAYT